MKTIAQQLNWDFEVNGNLEIRNKDWQLIYLELSNAFWAKWEYNSRGNQAYYQDSKGVIIDNRPKSCEGKMVEFDGVKYKLVKV